MRVGVQQQLVVAERVVMLCSRTVAEQWVMWEEQQIADGFAQLSEADAENGFDSFVALVENFNVQCGVVARVVSVGIVRVFGFEAAERLEC